MNRGAVVLKGGPPADEHEQPRRPAEMSKRRLEKSPID